MNLPLAVPLLMLSGVAFAADGCVDLTGLPVTPKVTWSQVWQALDTQSSCTQNCHLGTSPPAGLELSNASLSIYFLVGQDSGQASDLLRVRPGDPQGSLFWQKVACSSPDVGRPMPPPAGGVSLEVMALIYDWIDQGAYGESAEDPIVRDYLYRDSMESLRRVPPVSVALPFVPPSEQHPIPDVHPRAIPWWAKRPS